MTRFGGRCFVSADERGGKVVHVRPGRAGDDKIAGIAQRVVGIVVFERVRNGTSRPGKALDRAAVHKAARGVRRAVRTVRADREYNGVLQPRNLRGGGKRKLLIAPALAVPGEPDNRFAAEDKCPRHTRRGIFPCQCAEARTDLAGNALLAVGEDLRRIAKPAAGFRRGGAQFADAAGNAYRDVVRRFRRLAREKLPRAVAQPKSVFVRRGKRVRAGG